MLSGNSPAMKYFSLLSALAGLLLLTSCSTPGPIVWPSPLEGKWINRDGDLLVFNVDDTVSLDLKEQNAPEVWGYYAIDGDRLIFWNRNTPRGLGGGHSVGIYRLHGQRNLLWLQRISDPSAKRSRRLAEVWRRP